MRTITSWLRQLGTSGAVVNARTALDRQLLAAMTLDQAVAAMPAAAVPRRSEPAA